MRTYQKIQYRRNTNPRLHQKRRVKESHLRKNIKGEIGNRSIWLAASTHLGEEEIIRDVHQKVSREIPDLLTILVP